MKFGGATEIGPLIPKIAISNLSPTFAKVVSTTRFRHVEAPYRGGTRITRSARQLSVDPHLGVVIDQGSQDNDRARRIELPDLGWERQQSAIPEKRHVSPAAASAQRVGTDFRPGGIVEFELIGARRNIVRRFVLGHRVGRGRS